MHISGNSGSTAPKVKLAGSRSNTSSLLCPRWTRDQSRQSDNSRSMDGNVKRRMKSGRLPQQENSSNGPTRSFGIHSSCASSPSHSSPTSMPNTRTWKSGTLSFGARTLPTGSPNQVRWYCCTQNATPGGTFTIECMREPPSKRPCRHRRQTPSFGNERSMRDSPNQTRAQASPKVLGGRTPKARAKYDPHSHRSSLSGLKANNLRKGKRRKGPRRARTTTGPRTGQLRPLKGCNFARISFSGTSAQETVADPMDARLSRMGGPAMAPITLTSAQTNEKGGWRSSKRASPPFKQTHLWRRNRSHTTTPPGGRLLLRGARNTHGGMTPFLSNTTPNNLKQVVRRIVLLRISLTTTLLQHNVQP